MSDIESLKTENAALKVELAALKKAYEELEQKHALSSKIMFDSVGTLAKHKKKTKAHMKKKHAKFGAITLARFDLRLEETRVTLAEVVEWLQRAIPSIDVDPSGHNLFEQLQSGIELCDLLLAIQPTNEQLVRNDKRVHRRTKLNSFQKHENINNFLTGVSLLGAALPTQLTPTDLVDGNVDGNRNVLYALLHLAKVAHAKYNFIEPPKLALMETEIDELGLGGEGLANESKAVSNDIESVSDEEAAVIATHLAEICEELDRVPMKKVSKGTYLYGQEQLAAHVRVIHDTVLIRHQKEWFAARQFIKDKHDVFEQDDTKVVSPPQEEEEATAEPAESEEAKAAREAKEAQERRNRQMDAYKEFFYLTCLSVKMSSDFRDEILMISNDELFDMCRVQDVDFYQFQTWIKNKLMKIHLESIATSRLSLSNGPQDDNKEHVLAERLKTSQKPTGGLRAQRASVINNMRSRKEAQARRNQ